MEHSAPSYRLTVFFFFNDPAPPEIYPFPLHAAFPIFTEEVVGAADEEQKTAEIAAGRSHRAIEFLNPSVSAVDLRKHLPQADLNVRRGWQLRGDISPRSEEHTSELQSRLHLVCRLLLE